MCTTSRARKVVVALTMVALIAIAIEQACWHLFESHMRRVAYDINAVTFRAVVPVTVLIINSIVVREVRRRASSDAASNLGLQHHQSTSSNSAVPTVMLVTTSLIYVLLNGVLCFAYVARALDFYSWYKFYDIALHLYTFVYAYNFYVYLITGKQFRSELLKHYCACCRSSSSSSSSSPPPVAATAAAANVRVVRRGQADTAV